MRHISRASNPLGPVPSIGDFPPSNRSPCIAVPAPRTALRAREPSWNGLSLLTEPVVLSSSSLLLSRSSSSRSLSLSLSLFGLFSTGRDGAFIFNASRPRAFSSGTRVSSRFVASRQRFAPRFEGTNEEDDLPRSYTVALFQIRVIRLTAVDVITPYPTRPRPRETFRHGCRFASRREKSRRLKEVSGGVSIRAPLSVVTGARLSNMCQGTSGTLEMEQVKFPRIDKKRKQWFLSARVKEYLFFFFLL